MKILHIQSSVFNDSGQSSRLANEFTAELRAQHPGAHVVRRDLAANPVPHLDGARVAAFFAKPLERTAEQQAVVDYSDILIRELRDADVLVLGLPMYNFGVPSQLKAWFDHIARAGETFKYTETGSVGLLSGKRAYVFAARGGVYAGTANDWQTQFVRFFLGFIGISDVEFIYAEGLALGEESRNKSTAAAQADARRLATQTRLAA
jgi:FMN-dependent NADH-azoreductase